MTRVARADKLLFFASEISDVEVDAESLAFMGQALVQTTLPHTDPGISSIERTSGAVSLSIIADPQIGLPFGTIPRLFSGLDLHQSRDDEVPAAGSRKKPERVPPQARHENRWPRRSATARAVHEAVFFGAVDRLSKAGAILSAKLGDRRRGFCSANSAPAFDAVSDEHNKG
ncbi:MAG: hypothetical protein V5B40_04725 [Candidatus Accumulibacter meliphilus]|uniref:hypothetical protein n=1 Tax=Candidatus Accumulibacter meliphilus TaxID=2211374 RepID=UPI002FC2DF6D